MLDFCTVSKVRKTHLILSCLGLPFVMSQRAGADSTKTGVRSANQSGYVDKYVGGNWIVDALGQQ